jgi:hypothetical protein
MNEAAAETPVAAIVATRPYSTTIVGAEDR